MWFPNKSFFLNFDFKHSSSDTTVELYDADFNFIDNIVDNQLEVFLPCKIIIRLVNVEQSEIRKVSLANIKFNNDNLLQILEYKVCKYKLRSIVDLEKFPSIKSTKFNHDGYFILNLFHRNPFAIHLYVGNTINFKL